MNAPNRIYAASADEDPRLLRLFDHFMEAAFATTPDPCAHHPAIVSPVHNRCYLVGADEEIVGGFSLGQWSRKIAVLTNLNIRKDRRGRGYGRDAVRLAEALATTAGRDTIRLWATDTLRPFYERLNYTTSGTVEIGAARGYVFVKTLQDPSPR